MQKILGTNFGGRVFIISHSGRRGRGGNRHFRLHLRLHFLLPTSCFLLRISRRGRGGNRHFLLLTILHTSYFMLLTILHTSYFMLLTLLHASNYTSHFLLPTSCFLLHASYFVLRNLATCIFCDGAVGAGSIVPYDAGEIGH